MGDLADVFEVRSSEVKWRGKLWKLSDDADPMVKAEYFERLMWIKIDGSLHYNSMKEGRALHFFDGFSLRELTVKVLGPSETCWSCALSIGLADEDYTPIILAMSDERGFGAFLDIV